MEHVMSAQQRTVATPVDQVQITSSFPMEKVTTNMVRFHAGPEHKQHLMGTVYVPKDMIGGAAPGLIEVTVTIRKVTVAPQS
jgi:hypothetical protein